MEIMTGEFTIAVHAVVYLNHKQSMLSSEEIAANVCTNAARIRKVLAKLKKADLVLTKEGLEGGYYLPEQAEETTLCQILEAIRELPVSVNWKSGGIDMDCQVASGMAAIMDDIYEQMNLACKEQLKQTKIKDIDQRIFG
jgi:Rrf2 family protein